MFSTNCRSFPAIQDPKPDRHPEGMLQTRGVGVLPYMGYIGMCGPKGYGFSAALVINRVSIMAILPPLW